MELTGIEEKATSLPPRKLLAWFSHLSLTWQMQDFLREQKNLMQAV